MKEQGATILFCSHSLFQVESMCTRALWVHDGRIMFDGLAHQAVGIGRQPHLGAGHVGIDHVARPVMADLAVAGGCQHC